MDQPKATDLQKHFEYIEQRSHRPSDMEIQNILRQMGKFKPAHELNCGSCGYNTCREKATDINFYVGWAINPAHQNPDLPINFHIKMNLVEELSKCLRKMGKKVKVSYF